MRILHSAEVRILEDRLIIWDSPIWLVGLDKLVALSVIMVVVPAVSGCNCEVCRRCVDLKKYYYGALVELCLFPSLYWYVADLGF